MSSLFSKILYGVLGLGCAGLGIIGIWIPGVPTTVFVLIALWAFSHSSTRLYRWFIHVPVLSSVIHEAHRFQQEGALTPRVKLISQGSAWLSFTVVTLVTHSWTLGVTLALVAVSCSVFMYITPTTQYRSADETQE